MNEATKNCDSKVRQEGSSLRLAAGRRYWPRLKQGPSAKLTSCCVTLKRVTACSQTPAKKKMHHPRLHQHRPAHRSAACLVHGCEGYASRSSNRKRVIPVAFEWKSWATYGWGRDRLRALLIASPCKEREQVVSRVCRQKARLEIGLLTFWYTTIESRPTKADKEHRGAQHTSTGLFQRRAGLVCSILCCGTIQGIQAMLTNTSAPAVGLCQADVGLLCITSSRTEYGLDNDLWCLRGKHLQSTRSAGNALAAYTQCSLVHASHPGLGCGRPWR